MKPLVSILIPTFNRPEHLLRAVRSAQLQSYPNIEIIVTDNSPLAATNQELHQIIDKRINYFKNNINLGAVSNWRKGLELATGKYCVILSDDDFFINPFYIEEAVRIVEENNVNLVITNCILGYPNHCNIGSSNYSGLIKGNTFRAGFWNQYWIPTISNMFNRNVAISLNAFHSNDILYSDIELWLNMMGGGRSLLLPTTIYLLPIP
jgi:glycosyltransferase involved in cell wall biosynthesis